MYRSNEFLKQIDTPEVLITLRKDGIVHAYYKKNVILDLELQMRMLEKFNEITGKKKSLFIFEPDEGVSITKEARDNAILIEDQTPVLATAVIANNLAYRMIANFYIKVQKPKSKYKVVENVEEAVKWLHSLKT